MQLKSNFGLLRGRLAFLLAFSLEGVWILERLAILELLYRYGNLPQGDFSSPPILGQDLTEDMTGRLSDKTRSKQGGKATYKENCSSHFGFAVFLTDFVLKRWVLKVLDTLQKDSHLAEKVRTQKEKRTSFVFAGDVLRTDDWHCEEGCKR